MASRLPVPAGLGVTPTTTRGFPAWVVNSMRPPLSSTALPFANLKVSRSALLLEQTFCLLQVVGVHLTLQISDTRTGVFGFAELLTRTSIQGVGVGSTMLTDFEQLIGALFCRFIHSKLIVHVPPDRASTDPEQPSV
ncbi:hypothetical protein HYW87_02655 [Candidatus Roizmanbacteria bacterium]|nr:hypothetical protein [Candidatus Roizmanbacteria bacterium]